MSAPAVRKDSSKEYAAVIEQNIARTAELGLITDIEELTSIVSITELVDAIVRKAWQAEASDVHIDPQQDSVVIRFRIDGMLHDICQLKKDIQPLLITRIKVLSGLRTDEHFVAHDGRFRMSLAETQVDLRVSIITTYNGENVVLRLLVSDARAMTLEKLGYSEHDLKILEHYIKKPHGMILATGPTGSGKTSTLYSMVNILNERDVAIVTIEDPIEFAVPGITQIQVNTQTNLTFAAGLRSIVRQDPNTILVGEIRDSETANIAVNAAMTGHRVLSTLHTTNAATTLPRLLDMEVEPFLIASTVNVAIGQRLVRRLCENCRAMKPLDEKDRIALHDTLEPGTLEKFKEFGYPQGCDKCNNTGYSKRVGIYEVMEMGDEIRKLIMTRSNSDEIQAAAVRAGMVTMLEDGITKAAAGMTSVAEILRVILD